MALKQRYVLKLSLQQQPGHQSQEAIVNHIIRNEMYLSVSYIPKYGMVVRLYYKF